MNDFQEQLQQVRQEIDSGDVRSAFQTMRVLFQDLSLADRPDDLSAVLELLEPVAREIGGDEFGDRVHSCCADPDDPQATFDLGCAFLEEGVADVAACLLARTLQFVPEEEDVLAALTFALEQDHRFEDAYKLVRANAANHPDSFFVKFLLAFNAIMCADLDAARRFAADMSDPPDEDDRDMAESIRAILARGDEVKDKTSLDANDLRGWHYVVTGGLLLHVSPDDVTEEMNGRYAFTTDSYERCKEGLLRLKEVLAVCDKLPTKILALTDRGSEILSIAAGEIFDVPVEPWTVKSGEGLVVAYDLEELEEEAAEALYEHHENQILFAHASCWTEQAYTPDITTYLYQAQNSPWDTRMQIVDEDVISLPPDNAEPKEIARRIVEAELDRCALDDIGRLRSLAVATGSRAAIRQSKGVRQRLWSGPVQSNRFC